MGLLRAGCAKPSCAIVTTSLLLLLGRRPLLPSDTLLPWTSSHPVQMGGWSPQAPPLLCPCYGLGLPCLPPLLLSNWSPGPLRFRHMSGEVTLAKTGMSLGASRPSTQRSGCQLVSESDFQASFYSCSLQGGIYPPKAVATGSRQMAAPGGTP